MSELETKPSNPPETSNVQEQVVCLQRQVTFLLLVLLVVSVTLTVFLWRQARLARADLAVLKEPATQIIQAFQKDKPRFNAFLTDVANYGKTHPDFAPIVNKYRNLLNSAGTNSAPPPK